MNWDTILEHVATEKRADVRKSIEESFMDLFEDGHNHPVEMHGTVIRFKSEPLIAQLVELGLIDMNATCLASRLGKLSRGDWLRFNRLTGYSLCGYAEIMQSTDEAAAESTSRKKARG